MAGRKRKTRSLPFPEPVWETRVSNVSSIINQPEIKEYSEISIDTAGAASVDYAIFCAKAGLTPVRDGWGLLHLTVRDKRGRRSRVTLATSDLTYHRVAVEAATHKSRKSSLDLAITRYPYFRKGWPGPDSQGGSWLYGGPAPWSAVYRDALPDTAGLAHAHGLQATTSGFMREVSTCLADSDSDARWTILDDTPLDEFSKIVTPDGNIQIFVPEGCGIMPGWPTEKLPQPCPCNEAE